MSKPNPLFLLTLWLLRVAMALCGLAAIATAVGLAVVPVIASNLHPTHFGIPAVIEGMRRPDVLAFAAFVLATAGVLLTLLFFVFRAAAAVVASAAQGDPFVAENAGRIARIGWLLLAVQALSILTVAVFEFLPTRLRDVYLDFGASPAGLLAILMIFVLAQIFRRGAEMRADLEGTV